MSGKVKISIMALALVAGSANAVKFTGDGADNLFSTAGNWDSVPVHLSNVFEIDGGSSSESRIQVDSLWSSPHLSAIGIKQVAPSAGWAYVEVLDGATLSATIVSLGQNGTSRKGDLIVRSGGTLAGGGGASGALNIGNATTGDGILTIEAGVAFSQARLDLQETGTLIFEFGADSVSTFTSTRTTAGNANYLDGLLQLDLNALNTAGVYTLIDGNSQELLVAGALKTALDNGGGLISDTGDYSSANFSVLNGGSVQWSLTTADNGQDLVLNVTAIPEPATMGLFFISAIGLAIVRHCQQ